MYTNSVRLDRCCNAYSNRRASRRNGLSARLTRLKYTLRLVDSNEPFVQKLSPSLEAFFAITKNSDSSQFVECRRIQLRLQMFFLSQVVVLSMTGRSPALTPRWATILSRGMIRIDQRCVHRFHAGRTRQRSQEPVVDAHSVVGVHAGQIANGLSDRQLHHADHALSLLGAVVLSSR